MSLIQIIRPVRWHRFWLTGVIAIGVVAVVLLHEPILEFAARWLDVGEAPRAADYVMVLPGGPERRPFVAIAMLRCGMSKEILTAETETTPATDEGLVPGTDSVLRKILLRRGIRDDQIQVLPGKSNSTWTDAVALSKFLNANPKSTVAIVTDDYHTRRARWVFRRVLGDLASRIFFVSAKQEQITVSDWWQSEMGLDTYITEYCKLIIYFITDRIVLGTTVGLAIVAFVAIYGIRRRAIRRITA